MNEQDDEEWVQEAGLNNEKQRSQWRWVLSRKNLTTHPDGWIKGDSLATLMTHAKRLRSLTSIEKAPLTSRMLVAEIIESFMLLIRRKTKRRWLRYGRRVVHVLRVKGVQQRRSSFRGIQRQMVMSVKRITPAMTHATCQTQTSTHQQTQPSFVGGYPERHRI